MCKLSIKSGLKRIDPCMKRLIWFINENADSFKVLACCCGHKKYNMSIIVKDTEDEIFDIISGITIPRKKRFYKKDKEGYYYIPEVLENE